MTDTTTIPVTLSIKVRPGEENLIRQYAKHLFEGEYNDETPLDHLIEALLMWVYDEMYDEMYCWYAMNDEAVEIPEFAAG